MRIKTFSKKLIAAGFAAAVSLIVFCGCGANGENSNTNTIETLEAEEEDVSDKLKDTVETKETADSDPEVGFFEDGQNISKQQAELLEAARIRHRYSDVLSELLYAWSLPDMEVEMPQDYEEIQNNKYAITDIDCDGREELIIVYTTASMAGMFEAVYDYNPDTDILSQEYIYFPSVSYYDNGIIKAEASHNHSMGMDFLPFTLYKYNVNEDVYEQIGYVETWCKEDSASYKDKPFPDGLDTDADGVLYNIQNGSEESYEFEDYKYNLADYEEWYDSIMTGANEIKIDYKPLSFEEVINCSLEYLNLLDGIRKANMTDMFIPAAVSGDVTIFGTFVG